MKISLECGCTAAAKSGHTDLFFLCTQSFIISTIGRGRDIDTVSEMWMYEIITIKKI